MSQFETGQLGGVFGRNEREEDIARAEEFYGVEAQPFEMRDDGLKPANESAGGRNISEMERIVSLAAGAGLATVGLVRGRWDGLMLTALGAGLVWRGYSGRCQCYAALGINTAEHNRATAVPAKQGEKIEKSITICRPPEELYGFWRRLENLPRVMEHLKTVEPIDSQRSHWVAEGVLGKCVEWDAEILNERENELIAWRSLPGGDIDTAGSIRFVPSMRDGCTDVTLSMKYNPPAGKLGAQVASWLGEGLEQKLDEDLNRFKSVMEAAAPAESEATAAASSPWSETQTY